MVVDQFFNETVQHADIVLPVTTTFEQWDVCSSYWHYWLSVNEPAIKPLYECKSDPEIAALLSAAINKIESGSCTFPQEFNPKKWLDEEFNDELATQFGIRNWEDLLAGPHKAKCRARQPGTIANSKPRPANMSSSQNAVLPMVIRHCRSIKNPRKASCHFICLPPSAIRPAFAIC